MGEILFLTNSDNTKELFDWICSKVTATYCSEPLDLELLKTYNPKFVVSYNYKYIVPAECIKYMNGRIVNMHISYLPFNRGASPNIWSFIEDTPKGVTIHEMTDGLDKGKIIFQKELHFDNEKETLATTYDKLNIEMTNLFKEHFNELYLGNYEAKNQVGKGSYHSVKDLNDFATKINFKWSDKINDFLIRVKEAKKQGII